MTRLILTYTYIPLLVLYQTQRRWLT